MQPAALCLGNDGLRQGMLGLVFSRGRPGERLVVLYPVGHRDVDERRLALGEGSGLIEHNHVDVAESLERQPVRDQDAGSRRTLCRNGYDQRDGQSERVRAGDDEHADRPCQRIRGGTERCPDHHGDQCAAEGKPEQHPGGAVSDALRPCARRLGLSDQVLDSSQCSVLADCCDLNTDGGIRGDGACHDGVPHCPQLCSRLTRDHGLINAGGSLTDYPVCRDTRAGTYENDVSDDQLRWGDLMKHVAVDKDGGVRQQRRQRVEGRSCLGEGTHLDPVSEQHDVDEQRKLPPEVHIGSQDAHARPHGGEERNADRHADQQHHPRRACPEFAECSAEERSPTNDEHHGTQHRGDPADPGLVWQRVSDQGGEHRREGGDGDAHREHPPEQPSEQRRVACVVRAHTHAARHLHVVMGHVHVTHVVRMTVRRIRVVHVLVRHPLMTHVVHVLVRRIRVVHVLVRHVHGIAAMRAFRLLHVLMGHFPVRSTVWLRHLNHPPYTP